jgi:hypothetical protein
MDYPEVAKLAQMSESEHMGEIIDGLAYLNSAI